MNSVISASIVVCICKGGIDAIILMAHQTKLQALGFTRRSTTHFSSRVTMTTRSALYLASASFLEVIYAKVFTV